jgi:hypothetical protein
MGWGVVGLLLMAFDLLLAKIPLFLKKEDAFRLFAILFRLLVQKLT